MTKDIKRVMHFRALNAPQFMEVINPRPDVLMQRLEYDSPDGEFARVLAEAHVYQIGSDREEMPPKCHATAELLARAPHLLAVSTHGAGYDSVDVEACTQAGVIAVNQAGGNAEGVAEHVVGMMLSLSKRIGEADRVMRREAGVIRTRFLGHDIFGKTVGIVGFSHIGGRVADLCAGIFKMRIIAFDPYMSAEQMAARGTEKVELDELLAQSDFVSVNCPLTESTRNMFGAREFGLMKKDAFFVTTARGGIHDEVALAEALREKRIAGAGLDVWEVEPPPLDHPLLQLDNVVATPHTGGVTYESRGNTARIAAQQLLDIVDGKRPPRLLNPKVWPVYVKRFEAEFGFAPK